ncbi:large ribosomal subunit protein bL19cy-like [Phragmites australis]|uniref:large ribosomal subunit protein bL19cy-like n=1 Tax=Phragmites australis TaxID=29695 RepID=UPI002D77DA01|nr:large ribosomal subunit protein bL19cy-like [Phragmites australis]
MASATAAVSGILLPHALLSHRSPPPQILAVASSFRRLSLYASPRRATHLVARADASADAGEPEPVTELEPVTASADAEEGEAEGGVAVAEEEEEADEPPLPRKPGVKFGEIIGILNKQFIEEAEKVKTIPDLRPGDIIELRMQRPNKRRLSLFKGIIIAKHKAGVHTTIRVRRIIAGVGVEITFPVYSPRIKEIKVIRHKKVRRAKLYYLKHKLPRFSTFK